MTRPPGHLYRRAARVVLLDHSGAVLLVRGHDPADSDESALTYWYTLGGGIEAGEDQRAAAVREVFEETGLRLETNALFGPRRHEEVVFPFDGVIVHQEQEFYVAAVPRFEPRSSGWQHDEARSTLSMRWVPLAAIADMEETVYPTFLVELVAEFRASDQEGLPE
jgi:8-oxo-dGTP pyrophosphatase MutT (NUDIX family)